MGQELAIFQQRRLWVVKIGILPLNFHKIKVSAPDFASLDKKNLKKKISNNFLTA